MALENECSVGRVLPEHRHARQKHEVIPPFWIEQGDADVQRPVHRRVLFLTRRAQLAEQPQNRAAQQVFRHQASDFRLADENRFAGVLERAEAAQHEVAQRDLRHASARQGEPAELGSCRKEELEALLIARRIRHDEAAVGRRIERRRPDDAAPL